MADRTDPRALAARSKLEHALVELCIDAPLSSVSVAQLSAKAGLARKTFYKHFSSIDDLARRVVAEAFVPVIESIPEEALAEPLSMGVVRHVLMGFTSDRERISRVTDAFGADLVIDVMKPVSEAAVRRMLAQQGIEEEFHVAYLSSGAVGLALALLRTWIGRDFADRPEDVLALVSPVLQAALQEFLSLAKTPRNA